MLTDGRLALAETDEPAPDEGEVLVHVRAVSVNRGELHRLQARRTGWRPGWDFAGELVECGPAVRGFATGDRVFGTVPGGAWAERVAAPVGYVARLPETVSWAQGAALPVAGVTAMRVLSMAARPLAGARVLVTGAAGGVGRLAVQLAAAASARVTAVVGSAERAHGLAALGAHEVTIGLDQIHGGFDLVLESVGGDSLARALSLVEPAGVVVTFGNSSRAETRFRAEDFYYAEAALRGYYFWRDLERRAPAEDLARLVAKVADGSLRLDIGECSSWEHLPEILERLRERRITGKAVLLLGADG